MELISCEDTHSTSTLRPLPASIPVQLTVTAFGYRTHTRYPPPSLCGYYCEILLTLIIVSDGDQNGSGTSLQSTVVSGINACLVKHKVEDEPFVSFKYFIL